MKSAAAIAVLFALAVAAKPVEQRQISITAQYYESSDCSGASVGSQSFSTGCAELNGGQYPGLIVTFSDASPFLTQYYTDGDCKGQDLVRLERSARSGLTRIAAGDQRPVRRQQRRAVPRSAVRGR